MRRDRLSERFRAIERPRVLVVGDVMLDHYVFGGVERISPEAPIPILRVEREEWRPGGAGSVAMMLAALGAEVRLVAAIGDDEAAARLERELTALALSTDDLFRLEGRPTTLKTRHLANVQHILRVDREETSAYGEAQEAEILARVRDLAAWADVVLLSDYGKGLLRGGLVPRIAEVARAAGRETILDPKKQPDYRHYRGVTAITPNRSETEAGTGIRPRDPASWREAAEALATALDLERVVLTLDREGIFLYERGGRGVHIETESRAVFDVTGAGDMVIATVGLCRAGGLSWEDAVRAANAAAGLEIQRVGVAALTREQVARAIAGGADPQADKITTLERFAREHLAEMRRQGRRIVYTNGCFDILHVGHVKLLQFASEQGDALVVGVNSDASARRLKGPGRPILDEGDRSRMLAALEAVDHVILFDEDTPIEHIQTILPDVLVKAADYEGRTVVGQGVVEANGGQVVLGPLLGGVSTTQIIERVKSVGEADETAGRAARAAAEAAYDAAERAARATVERDG